MAVKSQRGAREAIQHLSSIITDCGIPRVPSESFRQAKFNKDEATSILWSLLLNVVQLLLFLDSDSKVEEICDSLRYYSLSSTSSDSNNWQVATLVVKKYLLSVGYTRKEFFCGPGYGLGSGSRELLMAFGWSIQKSELMKKLFVYHLERAGAASVPFRASQALMVRGKMEECDGFQQEISQILSNLSEVVMKRKAGSTTELKSCDAVAKVDEALQKLAWLRGMLVAEWKSALNSRLAYLRLAHRLHGSTLNQRHSSEKPPHLNIHELFLLRYPDHLSSYLKKAEHHVACLQRLLQWQLHEQVFWQWMESVLDLQEREKASLLLEQQEEQSTEEEQKHLRDDGNSFKASNVVECQVERVESLTNKVQVLEKEVLCVLEKHKTYLEKIQRLWQMKVKSVHYEEIEKEHARREKELESLLLRANHETQLKLLRVKETTSTAEAVTQQDRAVYVASAETERGANPATLQRRPAALTFLTPLQQQQSDNAKLLHNSRCFHKHILSELDRKRSLILQQKEDIVRELQLREEHLPTSLCKIET